MAVQLERIQHFDTHTDSKKGKTFLLPHLAILQDVVSYARKKQSRTDNIHYIPESPEFRDPTIFNNPEILSSLAAETSIHPFNLLPLIHRIAKHQNRLKGMLKQDIQQDIPPTFVTNKKGALRWQKVVNLQGEEGSLFGDSTYTIEGISGDITVNQVNVSALHKSYNLLFLSLLVSSPFSEYENYLFRRSIQPTFYLK